MENFRKPLFIALASAAAISALGAALGWFTIENQLVRELAESELGNKQNISIGITAACLGIAVIAAKLNKQRIAFLGTLIGIYGLILIINQKPEAAIAEQIGLLVKPGYWMSILGTLVVLLGNAIIGVKGFDPLQKK